jgi:phospholipid/cholesterol/gamma-HCH transport system substrate-binding protein
MTRRSHFKLGLFIIVCTGCLAIALIWIGATRIFEHSRTYAAFFDQAVTGLQSGAPVEHLGVRVGSVDSIELAPGGRLVRVLVKLQSDFQPDPSMALSIGQGSLTGSPFLALDEAPAGERRQVAHPPTKYAVLATRAGGGGIGAAVAAIEGVAQRLDAILSRGDLEQTLANARAASEGLRRVAGAGPQGQPSQLETIARQLDETSAAGEHAVRRFDHDVGDALVLLRQDLTQLKQAAADVRGLARSLRSNPGRIVERGTTPDPFQR